MEALDLNFASVFTKLTLKLAEHFDLEKFPNSSNCVSCSAPCLGLKHVYNCAVYFYTLVPSTRGYP